MEYTVSNSQSSLSVIHKSFANKWEPVAAASPSVKRIDVEDIAPRNVSASEASFKFEPFDMDRRSLFIYTSGTTGKPKGVVHTHRSIDSNITSLVEAWKWSSSDHILHTLPLNHVHGIVNILLCSLYSGATCEFVPFEAQSIWERFADPKHLTLFMAVPTVYSRLAHAWHAATPEQQKRYTEACKRFRVMVSGSAPLPSTMFDEWVKVSGGQRLLERYGMSEIGMALGNPLEGDRVPGTVGVPFPGVEVKLASVEDGSDVTNKIDTPGEILVNGKNIFLEYWNRPDATAEVFDEQGWFKTGGGKGKHPIPSGTDHWLATIGDIAVREKNNYFRILGRASMDIIKVNNIWATCRSTLKSLPSRPQVRRLQNLRPRN